MSEYVIRRFPEWREEILQLLKERADFQEICEDYEALTRWLDEHCKSAERFSKNCNEARDMMESLEIEIMEILLAVYGQEDSEK